MVTNPAPCVRPDGRALLIYKSVARRGERLQLGAAIADHYDGPYRRLSDEPIVHLDDPMAHVEDPYVWWDGRRYQMVMKDMTGAIGGEERGGVGAWSDDGVHWQLHDPPTTYSRRLRLADGSERWVDSLERPQLLIEHGRPTYLFAATAELDGVGNDGTYRAHRSWNMAIRLGPGEA